jgi:hypothetical protein
MFKLFKLYRKSQQAQLNWIRNHPGQWITLNVILTVMFIAFIEYMDRRETAKFLRENPIVEEAA